MRGQTKTALRKEARQRRAACAKSVRDFAARLASHTGTLGIPRDSTVGAYIAIGDEADPHILLEQLRLQNCTLAFPRIAAENAPLVFHHCKTGQTMPPGRYGIAAPSPDWPIAHPQILLVPLLAFDARGHRLGYGGGYYDRTITAMRAAGPLRVIGIAYAGQEMERLPDEAHDHPLDMVVTELGVRRFHQT